MQPTIAERLEHIATAIRNIRKITTGQTRESFAGDLIIRLATERLLEVISEASRHIPLEIKSKESSINWRRLLISETGCAMPTKTPTLACYGP